MERLIYNLVKDRPWLKDVIKKVYQGIFSMNGRRREFGTEQLTIRDNCFFGFHDKSPWSANNKILLSHRYTGTGNEPESAQHPVEIVLFEGDNWQNSRIIAQTQAWNWQQGAQLQWKGENIVFNDFNNGMCQAKELSTTGELVKIHPFPVGAISADGLMAGFCFKTLGEVMPGYGYDYARAKAESNIPADTLIVFKQSDEVLFELSSKDFPATVTTEPDRGQAFVSHTLFNRSGNKLGFMRRLAIPGRRLRSELFVLDITSGHITRVPFKDMVSHYCWLDDETIFAFASTEAGDGYYRYSLKDNALKDFSSLLGHADGHPHADSSGNYVVFDSYPNRNRLQRLALLNTQKGTINELASLYSPLKFWGTKRVDLHPRMRADGRYVCIDCSTTGKRSLATLPIAP